MTSTCLVVDSDVTMRQSIELVLQEIDVKTIGVGSANEALEIIEDCHVDLVLAEEFLPGKTGTQLLEVVKERWPLVARVLVGAALGSDVLARAVNRARVHRVLFKSMHPIAFRDEVEAALNECLRATRDTIPAPSAPRLRLAAKPGAEPEPPSVRLNQA